MKRTLWGLLLLLSAALLGAEAARIQQVTGTVEVKAPGAGEWQAAAAGQELDTASLISTGFRSTALVRIGNSTVTVRALTRLSLEELAGTPTGERVTLELRAGRIRAEVQPPVGGTTRFTVRSPTATASVRGTVFEFDGIRLEVSEGRVYLGGERAAGVYVGTGHGAAADPERGRTVPVIETVKAELSPALPAGVDAAPAAVSPRPSNANLDLWFEWGEE